MLQEQAWCGRGATPRAPRVLGANIASGLELQARDIRLAALDPAAQHADVLAGARAGHAPKTGPGTGRLPSVYPAATHRAELRLARKRPGRPRGPRRGSRAPPAPSKDAAAAS